MILQIHGKKPLNIVICEEKVENIEIVMVLFFGFVPLPSSMIE